MKNKFLVVQPNVIIANSYTAPPSSLHTNSLHPHSSPARRGLSKWLLGSVKDTNAGSPVPGSTQDEPRCSRKGFQKEVNPRRLVPSDTQHCNKRPSRCFNRVEFARPDVIPKGFNSHHPNSHPVHLINICYINA